MKLLVAVVVSVASFLQPGPRAPLAPAETLLEPGMLRAIQQQAPNPDGPTTIKGSDAGGEILIFCADDHCGAATRAVTRLSALVAAKTLPQPRRSIRLTSNFEGGTVTRAVAVLHVAERKDRPAGIVRGLWSTAGIGDEVAEIFGRHFVPGIDVSSYQFVDQPGFSTFGIPETTIVANPTVSNDNAAVITAATAYFLATLPNAGAEALLSHLTVGAHARLAEDGRKAVAQMGTQQRASADVLIMFGQAIEREQRRMRSFESFMPKPVDPMLHSRIVDMERGITSVWTSMGITSSPFVPAAERIRGRGGEDRRVPRRTDREVLPKPEPPSAFLKFENADSVIFELGCLIDGNRSISDIRDVLTAEFGPIALPVVTDYIERLVKTGAVAIK